MVTTAWEDKDLCLQQGQPSPDSPLATRILVLPREWDISVVTDKTPACRTDLRKFTCCSNIILAINWQQKELLYGGQLSYHWKPIPSPQGKLIYFAASSNLNPPSWPKVPLRLSKPHTSQRKFLAETPPLMCHLLEELSNLQTNQEASAQPQGSWSVHTQQTWYPLQAMN